MSDLGLIMLKECFKKTCWENLNVLEIASNEFSM